MYIILKVRNPPPSSRLFWAHEVPSSLGTFQGPTFRGFYGRKLNLQISLTRWCPPTYKFAYHTHEV
jgi:hypothetical protein